LGLAQRSQLHPTITARTWPRTGASSLRFARN